MPTLIHFKPFSLSLLGGEISATQQGRVTLQVSSENEGYYACVLLWRAGITETVLAQILQSTAVQILIQLLVHAGGVGLAVFGSYARYTGVAKSLFILLSFFVGQGAYLGSEYWLITWAYRFARTLSENCNASFVGLWGGIMWMHARADHLVRCGLPSLCTEDVQREMSWPGPCNMPWRTCAETKGSHRTHAIKRGGSSSTVSYLDADSGVAVCQDVRPMRVLRPMALTEP